MRKYTQGEKKVILVKLSLMFVPLIEVVRILTEIKCCNSGTNANFSMRFVAFCSEFINFNTL